MAAIDVVRIGDVETGWGESVVWDEQRQRLYFVDCATQRIHWLDDEDGELASLPCESMPAGLVPTDDGRILVVFGDGLHGVDPDTGSSELLATYPEGLGARGNDACADLEGNVVTGTLNLEPAPGSAWRWSPRDGWRLLDPDISNTNGPQALTIGGEPSLIIGDSSGHYYAYDYDAASGTVGERRIFGDVTDVDGVCDGTTLDAADGLWCAMFGGSQLVRFDADGLDRRIELPMSNPTDVTFGGPGLDRLYVVSAGSLGAEPKPLDGALVAIDGLGSGRVEPRAHLGR
jgi:sugar lactone lactonase YvrE